MTGTLELEEKFPPEPVVGRRSSPTFNLQGSVVGTFETRSSFIPVSAFSED